MSRCDPVGSFRPRWKLRGVPLAWFTDRSALQGTGVRNWGRISTFDIYDEAPLVASPSNAIRCIALAWPPLSFFLPPAFKDIVECLARNWGRISTFDIYDEAPLIASPSNAI